MGSQLQLKCSAILENFFFKSAELVVMKEGSGPVMGETNLEQEGKILGLFDDDSFRERQEADQQETVRNAWTSSKAVILKPQHIIIHTILLLLFKNTVIFTD